MGYSWESVTLGNQLTFLILSVLSFKMRELGTMSLRSLLNATSSIANIHPLGET